MKDYTKQPIIDHDSGKIEGEDYEIKLTHKGPVFNVEAVQKTYGALAPHILNTAGSFSCQKVKSELSAKKCLEFTLNGQNIKLEEGIHVRVFYWLQMNKWILIMFDILALGQNTAQQHLSS